MNLRENRRNHGRMAVVARCCRRRSEQTAGGHTNTYINSDPGLWQKHTARNKASEAEQKQSEKQSKRSSQQARAES